MGKLILLFFFICGALFTWGCISVMVYLLRYKYNDFGLRVVYFFEAAFNLKYRKELFVAEWQWYMMKNRAEVARIKKQEEENKTLHPVEDAGVGFLNRETMEVQWELVEEKPKKKKTFEIKGEEVFYLVES